MLQMVTRVTTSELLTVREAARRRNVSRAAIYQAIREGRLTSIPVAGGGVVLSVREVDAYTPRAHKSQPETKKQAKASKIPIKPGSAKGMTYSMSDDFNAPIGEFSEYR